MSEFGWFSVLPPIVAIVLAIATRRVVVSLLVGVVAGALIISKGNLIEAVPLALKDYLWASLIDADHLRVLAFTSLMGAMVGVVYHAGGMHGIVQALSPLVRGRRGGQLMTWLLGLIVFFDDYANTLLLGGTMRPLADRLRISREKLAYLVDSTAAPVAGLAIISTWVAGEIGYIEDGYNQLAIEPVNGFDVFVQTIPYRFYVLLSLMLVPLVALLGRDFGPMLTAERKRMNDASETSDESDVPLALRRDVPARWYNAAIPVLLMIGVTIGLLLKTGESSIINAAAEADLPTPSPTWIEQFREGNSYVALLYGSLVGWLSSLILAAGQRLLPAGGLASATKSGIRQVLPALAILWLAWSLSSVTGGLKTAEFLGGLLQQSLPVYLMPTIVFLLASVIAFATGTSWGTMGILTPLVVSVTYRMLTDTAATPSPVDPILIASIGSVLAGAIFGDHCSPISDTTVLSSSASGCDHVAHVWTQMPYALLVATVSILCGTLPIGFGVSLWVAYPLSLTALVAFLIAFGRNPESQSRIEMATEEPPKQD